MENDATESSRREAIARGLCARIIDERLTIEDLLAVDELLGRITMGNRSGVEDELLARLYDDSEHTDAYTRGHNDAMRQAIRIVMAANRGESFESDETNPRQPIAGRFDCSDGDGRP